LAIQLIDALLSLPAWQDRWRACRAIDIGTGSGVLAIVAAKMGMGRVYGLDIDPCAVFEACENVRLNRVETRVSILNSDQDGLSGFYDLVLANLRMPTLFTLRSVMEQKLTEHSILVFSGLKSEEVTPVCDFYAEAGFFILQKRSEKGWSAICLARGSFLDDGTAPMV
jgi:ribosomal protein L11 methyltransferase